MFSIIRWIHPRIVHRNHRTRIRYSWWNSKRTPFIGSKGKKRYLIYQSVFAWYCSPGSFYQVRRLFFYFYWVVLYRLFRKLLLMLYLFNLIEFSFMVLFRRKLFLEECTTLFIFFDYHLCCRKLQFETMCCSTYRVIFFQYKLDELLSSLNQIWKYLCTDSGVMFGLFKLTLVFFHVLSIQLYDFNVEFSDLCIILINYFSYER